MLSCCVTHILERCLCFCGHLVFFFLSLDGERNALTANYCLNKDVDGGIRTPGDIDVWIDASRERIMEYTQKKFELGDDVRLQHLETSLDGVPVELHFFPCSMNNPIYHARLQKWFRRN